jgi:hypothetical protein
MMTMNYLFKIHNNIIIHDITLPGYQYVYVGGPETLPPHHPYLHHKNFQKIFFDFYFWTSSTFKTYYI